VITDAEELRVKECDRIAVMASQLAQLGARVEEHPDGLTIHGGPPLTGAIVDSYTDHRVAMSLAIAALRANGPMQVQRAEAAAVSYPSFTATLAELCGLSLD
jgi:3-phosphoshikimate 1-carboxyvinyltransferase